MKEKNFRIHQRIHSRSRERERDFIKNSKYSKYNILENRNFYLCKHLIIKMII